MEPVPTELSTKLLALVAAVVLGAAAWLWHEDTKWRREAAAKKQALETL